MLFAISVEKHKTRMHQSNIPSDKIAVFLQMYVHVLFRNEVLYLKTSSIQSRQRSINILTKINSGYAFINNKNFIGYGYMIFKLGKRSLGGTI